MSIPLIGWIAAAIAAILDIGIHLGCSLFGIGGFACAVRTQRLPVSPTLYLSRRHTDIGYAGAQRRFRKIRAECGTPALCTVYTNMVCDTLTPVQPGAPTHAVSPCVLQHLHEYSRCFAFCWACHIAPRAHGGSCLFCVSLRLCPRHRTLMDETHDELHYECLSDFLLADTDTFTTGSSLGMEETPTSE